MGPKKRDSKNQAKSRESLIYRRWWCGCVCVCVCVAVGCGECKKAEAQVTSAAKPWQVCGVGVGEVGASVVHRWWWVAHCAVFASVWKCVMWCVSVR